MSYFGARMALRPIFYHSFPLPLPYAPALALQQRIHELQLQQRRTSPDSHDDVLLLLQHRPVYTTGRRQTEEDVRHESERLRHLGADFVVTKRGGQTTFHGPGQVVGYPLLDLRRMRLSIADYICNIQTMLKQHFLINHGISTINSDNTGVFTAPDIKIASIGVQIRHRLTSHGFAYNVTQEPRAWFDQVVACGLADVRAGCIEEAAAPETVVDKDIESLIPVLARVFQRDVVKLDAGRDGPLEEAVREMEAEAIESGPWLDAPVHGSVGV